MAGRNDEVELATKTITIGGKRFSLDVKENRIGRFIKIRESDASGTANKILLPSGGALGFHEALKKIASPAVTRKATPAAGEDGRKPSIHSEFVQVDTKRFHLDYIENTRGRVLKISQVGQDGKRVSLMVPAEKAGVEELSQAFEEVMKSAGDGMVIANLSALGVSGKGGGEPGEGDIDLGSKILQIDNKRFFLDLKQNKIGRFLKITETMENGTKQKIAIPAASVGHFRDLVQKMATTDVKDKVLPPGPDGNPPSLASESMKIDLKTLFMDLKSNVRGRLLKISAVGNDNRTSIMLPGKPAQLDQFSKGVSDLMAIGETAGGNPNASEETLAESIVQVQNKRFFVDLKSNLRGKFLKITEVSDGGGRNKVIVPGDGIVQFYETMHVFAGKHSRQTAPVKPKGEDKSGTVHSQVMTSDGKTFYFDLLDNARGRVMKVAQMAADQRVTIMLPAIGLEGFTAALAGVLREGGELVADAAPSSGQNPGKPGEGNVDLASKLVNIEGKRFFIDLKENEIGRFVQLAEVDSQGKRTKMSLPLSSVGQFRDVIGIFADLDTSALGKQAYTDGEGRPTALRSEYLKVDRKQVHFDLTANARGCVLKVSMRDDRGRTTLMIPAPGLPKLRDSLAEIFES